MGDVRIELENVRRNIFKMQHIKITIIYMNHAFDKFIDRLSMIKKIKYIFKNPNKRKIKSEKCRRICIDYDIATK